MLPSLEPQRYLVKPGDSLARIAAQRGYPDWRVVWNAPSNGTLRRARPDPNRLLPGDVVMLPPRPADIRTALEHRLVQLERIRRDAETLFAGLGKELDGQLKAVEQTATNVDTAKDVFDILHGLSKMAYKGWKSLSLAGEELEKANRELAKDALDMPKEQLGNVAMKTYTDMARDPQTVEAVGSSVWLFGAAVIQSWLDINSPSFWANTIAQLQSGSSWSTAVTTTPADVHRTAKERLLATRRDAIRRVDEKIAETRRLLGAVSGPQPVTLPLR
jgi:hypothetical protein